MNACAANNIDGMLLYFLCSEKITWCYGDNFTMFRRSSRYTIKTTCKEHVESALQVISKRVQDNRLLLSEGNEIRAQNLLQCNFPFYMPTTRSFENAYNFRSFTCGAVHIFIKKFPWPLEQTAVPCA